MKKIVVLLLFAIYAQSDAESDKRINIAVNDLTGQGIDQTTVATISERLRVELINTQSFRVMERSQMTVILQEQGFQQSDCADNSCIVKMGQLLGVEHMIMGTIGRVGSMYTISLRMVNVATGEVLYTASEDCRCDIEEVLTASTPRIAMKLELAIEKAIFGALNIKSIPDSATVNINNNKIGFTNYVNDRFMPGNYQLSLHKATYEPVTQDIVIERNKAVNLSFKLEHTKAYLDSVKTATRHERFMKMFVRQVILGCLAAGCGGAGYYFNHQGENAKQTEQNAKTAYLAGREGSDFVKLYASYQDAGKVTEQKLLVRNVLYGVGGAFTASFAISFAF